MTDKLIPITVAYGDGIGPEIMEATLRIIQEAGAAIDIETIEIGEKVYLRGVETGIEPSAWESLRRTRVFLKAPITTPQGGGYKSLNVTVRKALGLYANVRPCVSYHPFIETKYPDMDIVVIRENEEDLYAGIEYRQTENVYQGLKLISRPGSEKIIRYAFEFAKSNGRKKVTCFVKDNIMKLTDGIFHRVFDEIAKEYPDIENESMIVDIGAAKMATSPENFDVIVMENLYGDILSDVAAQMTGSVGVAGSANIGEQCAMFEAIHGSAPRHAGKNDANPSGLLLGAVLMLNHIGQQEVASAVHNAFLKTLEEGVHTYDIYKDGVSKKLVGTKEFADEVILRLGKKPEILKPVSYNKIDIKKSYKKKSSQKSVKYPKDLVGVDIFLDWNLGNAGDLGDIIKTADTENLTIKFISNRGTKVWPEGMPETFCSEHWRCRFLRKSDDRIVSHNEIIQLLNKIYELGFDFIKTENLYNFNGEPGYTDAVRTS
jgi:isocitrate dehydrogenase